MLAHHGLQLFSVRASFSLASLMSTDSLIPTGPAGPLHPPGCVAQGLQQSLNQALRLIWDWCLLLEPGLKPDSFESHCLRKLLLPIRELFLESWLADVGQSESMKLCPNMFFFFFFLLGCLTFPSAKWELKTRWLLPVGWSPKTTSLAIFCCLLLGPN